MAQPAVKAIKRTWGSAIAASAMLGLQQKIPGIPLEGMFCLKFARLCIENALNLAQGGFYRLVTGVDGNPSARELEHLLRTQKPSWMVSSVKEIQLGDTVWWKDLPPQWGHVGIVVLYRAKWYVAQNTIERFKGIDYPGALRLIPLEQMPAPSSIIRIGG